MSHQELHPDSEMLVRAAFGELRPDETAPLHHHLAVCASCRTELDQIRETAAGFRAFYQSEFKETMPPPPRAWQTFRPLLEQCESRETGFFARFTQRFAIRRLSPVAVGLCLAILLAAVVYRMREAPPVSANEVLNRGVAAQNQALDKVTRAAITQKIRVRVGAKTFTRTLYRDVARKRQVDRWTGPDSPSSRTGVAGRFQNIQYDWDDPLSPSGIRDWMQTRRAHQQSSATTVLLADGVFTLTSVSHQDPVQEARFVVRQSDYHPVSAHFSFRGQDDLELTELAYSIQPLETIETAVRTELTAPAPSSPPEVPVMEHRPAAGSPDLDTVELQARYTLHRHHADLGEETLVERTPGAVTVRGLVASDQRRAELRSALAHMQGVRIELQTAGEAAAKQAGAIASAAPSADLEPRRPAVLQKALTERFPDQEARDSFVLATIECSQRALAHGFALRKLAERYTAGAVAALPDESRHQLLTMRKNHSQAIQANVQELFDRLSPLTGAVPEVAAAIEPARPWQEVQAPLLDELRQMDQIVVELVSSSANGAADPVVLLGRYRQCAARIRSEVASLAAGQQ